MRKVLLATTALVAMSVTAAQADVSVGGTAVFEIYSPGTGAQTFTSDGSVVIKGSTTSDSGLTFSAVQDSKFEGAATVNDAYVEVSGDFGTLRAGQTDGALDRMDGVLAANMDLEGTTGSAATDAKSGTAIGGDSQNISLHLPSMSGLSISCIIPIVLVLEDRFCINNTIPGLGLADLSSVFKSILNWTIPSSCFVFFLFSPTSYSGSLSEFSKI